MLKHNKIDKTAVLVVGLVSLLGLMLFSDVFPWIRQETWIHTLVAPFTPSEKIYAGFRCNGEGSVTYWVNVAKQMASAIPGTSSGGIWIIPESKALNFDSWTDSCLTVLDANGVKVLLQVGDDLYSSSIPTLIDATLGNYGDNSCVLGFGIDIELRTPESVTDGEAEAWVVQIKAYNPDFKLFLKHWIPEVMPPTAREGIIFIDDAQGFGSLNSMVSQFTHACMVSIRKSPEGHRISIARRH